MTNRNRDLLLLMKAASFTDAAFEKQLDALHKVLILSECNDAFCNAHELVMRTKITQKQKKILKAVTSTELKPFYFLINKN